jgi:hypothetical protein
VYFAGLPLLMIPYVFTQDGLLTSDEFMRAAKMRGFRVSLDDLQAFHTYGLLIPLYRVSDTAVEGRRINVVPDGQPNARGRTLQAAADGRLRDAWNEGYSVAWPYRCAENEDELQWWNGFIYSSWQLLDVRWAVNALPFIRRGWHSASSSRSRPRVTAALAALSTRYLPSVLGRLTWPVGAVEANLQETRLAANPEELLHAVGFPLADLAPVADRLLMEAHGEPLGKWLPLLRHSGYKGWSKLHGEPLDAMWRRVAAEVLLRAHEDLASAGLVESLPDLTGEQWWQPQHDRLSPRYAEAATLERALSDLGLSPHPKVILLVEGETELGHIPRLLGELGLTQPEDVRVQFTKGSKVNPHLIARYGVTPRIGRKLQSGWLLDATPTALVIAMDPENTFATADKRTKLRRSLIAAVREGVQHQGADIGQDVLDTLVNIQVWGEDTYEIANFTDGELIPAITALAVSQGRVGGDLRAWEQELRRRLLDARRGHLDIKVPIGQMKMREDKVMLAELLWPTLRKKFEAEYAAGSVTTPVLKLVVEVRQLVAKLTGVSAIDAP